MFDKYMIVGEEFKNVERDGRITGFQIGARLPYYRGLGVSMVEEIDVTVDGEPFSRDRITVTLHGNTYTLDELENEGDDRWEFGEVGILTVAKPGGLTPGEHTVDLREFLRISYMPRGFAGADSKVLTLAG